ncbi:hypothetical protein J2I47_11630 [Fibrella sp. HMF5335]|uniref:YD repeat-containing protein n=1 Tax=Fibrella rubiginis TaxID=2817060 RepID=A0A939GHB3_9BACT|nr:hypothetical protein [Fibrella rubiginis]MBO0937199.1 hypothetical protein [Fibrella rubiginis]
MKQISLASYLLLLFILSTALTCTDHRDQPTPAARFRVKTIAYTTLGNSKTPADGPFVLTYDSNGRLASYSTPDYTSRESFGTRAVHYTYPKTDYQFYADGLVERVNNFAMSYYFDSQNRLIRMRLNAYQQDRVIYDFIYNGNSTTPSSRITTRLDNNVVVGSRTENYSFTGSNATAIDGKSYTYDSSPNPYKGLFGFAAFSISSPDYTANFSGNINALNRPFDISERFSDSSVKVFNQNNRTTDAQLTYNSDGLVTKIVYNDGNSEEFTYETY